MSEHWNPKKPIGKFQQTFTLLNRVVDVFCRDCAHARGSAHFPDVGRLMECAQTLHRCPVDGHEEMSLCYDARSAVGYCGPEARLFEEKAQEA